MLDQNISYYIEKYQLEQIFTEQTMSHIKCHTFKAGELLVRSGDTVDQLYILVSGKLKISTALPNGRTMLLQFSLPFSMLGDIELIQKEHAKVQVEIMEDAMLLVLPHHIIYEYEMGRAVFLHYLLQQICSKMNTNFVSATLNILTNVEHRFASYLLSMYDAGEYQSHQKEELETSKLTDIAEMLGTSYRHLNRVVKKFIDKELIKKERRKITILNVDGLKALCFENGYREI